MPNDNWEFIVREQLKMFRLSDAECFFSSYQNQRELVPGSWAGVCDSAGSGKQAAGSDCRLGVQCMGRQISALR